MIYFEVKSMDHINENQTPETQQEGYTPRPMHQVWMARIGLVIFILFVIWQAVQIAGGFV